MTDKKRILNLGCGNDFYGTDRIDIQKTKATTKVFDIEKGLPFEDNTFDEVFSKCIFEHLKNPGFSLKEIKRVLKKNGRLILITDNAGYWKFYSFMGVHTGRYGNKSDKHYAVFTIEHLKNHMKSSDLEIKSIKYENFERPNFKGKLSLITNLLFSKIPTLRNLAWPRIKVIAIKK